MESPLPIPPDNPDNSSLLMELLNSSNIDEVDHMDLDFDEQIHNVMQAFGETSSTGSFDGSCKYLHFTVFVEWICFIVYTNCTRCWSQFLL